MWFGRKVRQVDTGLEAIPLQFNCPASWKNMSGNDQVRHCTHCDRKVYNLSDMSRFEAKSLIMREEGHLCMRYYLRPDGKILTRDCGVGVRMRTRARIAFGALVGAIGIWLFPRPIGQVQVAPRIVRGDPAVVTETPLMGAVAPMIGKPAPQHAESLGFISSRTATGRPSHKD